MIFTTKMKIRSFSHFAIFCVLAISILSCQSLKNFAVSNDIRKSLRKSEIFSEQFTGFALYDPEQKAYLAQVNSDLYYTPASNTKILTALACLEALKDSIPAYLYYQTGDSLFLEPLGDPSFLHPAFPQQTAFEKLKGKKLLLHFPDEEMIPFGSGWAWDDYHFSFQQERSWFPIYGNEVRIFTEDQSLRVEPDFFKDYVNVMVGLKPGSLVYREQKFNLFNIWMESDTSTFQRKIPFDYSDELLVSLLTDTLHVPIAVIDSFPDLIPDTLYNQSLLPVLSFMMQKSDNFLAEQLLAVSARTQGYTNVNAYRKSLLYSWSLPSEIQWVDGSGLSRYNLLTPEVLISVLLRIYQQLDWKTITTIFPTGGESGTIKYWYEGNPPYVFAKTGTLSNNHCLSGYLRTRSGKILVFSLMNNHYMRPVGEVKYEIQRFLESIRDSL